MNLTIEEWTAVPINENIIGAFRKSIAISALSDLGIVRSYYGVVDFRV